jgi:hypothetical protein
MRIWCSTFTGPLTWNWGSGRDHDGFSDLVERLPHDSSIPPTARKERKGMDWLCDTSEFLTRSQCGSGWTPWLKQTYQLANFLIWFSYLVIAFSLYKLYRSKRTELPAPGLFVLATMFLLLCGVSHLGNIAAFFWAPYRLFTVVDLMTASVAVIAACWMPSVVHWMAHLPAQQYVHTVNKTLADEVTQTRRTKHALIQQIEILKERNRALEHMLETKAWITEKSAVMEELSRDLSRKNSDREMT